MGFLFYYFRVSEIKLESVKSVKVHSPDIRMVCT